jgi:poly-beta-1,6-N-acetyl-D-glucosamine synthase
VKWVFWGSILTVFYTCLGYPLWLYLRSRWHYRPVYRAPIRPFVSIVMAVHNEAENLPRKLKNLSELQYPPDRFEIIVVSDGSTDGTNDFLSRSEVPICYFLIPQHRGKACALNVGIALAQGEIILFVDARQLLEAESLRNLVENFADPSVGCVSGELILLPSEGQAGGQEWGDYWRIEKQIRKLESKTGSVVGATGAIYAVRRELLVPLPEGTILDDVYIPLHVARQQKRVVFESRAVAKDTVIPDLKREFRRKVRTLTGNYQLLQIAPWVLTRRNRIRFEFISHKLCRLTMPLALVAVLMSSMFLGGTFYRSAFILQVTFYAAGLLAITNPRNRVRRVAGPAASFLMLNAAAGVGLINFLRRKQVLWVR